LPTDFADSNKGKYANKCRLCLSRTIRKCFRNFAHTWRFLLLLAEISPSTNRQNDKFSIQINNFVELYRIKIWMCSKNSNYTKIGIS
jgi:hypothetical protein